MKTDREKLYEILYEFHEEYGSGHFYLSFTEDEAEFIADYLISKGVTIPVRCGECKYWWKQAETCVHPKCCEGVVSVIDAPKTHFCGYGERKEE